MLELSLYQLDQQLTDLWAMRERVEDEIATAEYEGLQETKQRLQEEAQVIDDAMVLMAAAVSKMRRRIATAERQEELT